MMLVLGIGGLEKRTTPTLLHDETKKQRLLLDDDERTGDTALFGGGYIERGQRLVCVCDDFLLEREMDSNFFLKKPLPLSSLFFSIFFWDSLSQIMPAQKITTIRY